MSRTYDLGYIERSRLAAENSIASLGPTTVCAGVCLRVSIHWGCLYATSVCTLREFVRCECLYAASVWTLRVFEHCGCLNTAGV